MRKDNKLFVKSMIITSVIGFSVLMMTMFMAIKYYVGKDGTSSNVEQAADILTNTDEPKVEYGVAILALVRNITDDRLVAFDIEKNQVINKNITPATKIGDGYGQPIPLSSVEQGDIVELTFQPDSENIQSINRTSRSWSESDISGVLVNAETNEAVVKGKTYRFTKEALLFGQGGLTVEPAFIREYDVLRIQGVGENIWSIKVLKNAASIQLLNVPNLEGMLEIDRKRMIPLREVIGPVGMAPGRHKIQVSIKGYESFTKEITLSPEENYELSLKNMKEAFTEIRLTVANEDADYTVQVGSKTYQKGQKISVKQGSYKITVKAEGYKDWQQVAALSQPIYDVSVLLEKEEKEEEPTDGNTLPSDNNTGTAGNTGNTNTTTNNGGNTSNNTGTSGSSNGPFAVNISTDPAGAHVYFGGVYKGDTPFRTTLPKGDYAVSLEKDGFATYSTTIIVDGGGDDQNSFLYVLTPK